MKLLKALFAVQLFLGFVWTMPLVSAKTTLGWGPFYLFILTYPFHIAFMLIAIWSFVARPATRRWALVVFVLPIVLFYLPALVRDLFGGQILSGGAVKYPWIALFLVPPAFCLFFPRKAAAFVPRFVFENRWLNIGLVVVLALMLAIGVALTHEIVQLIDRDRSGFSLGLLLFYLFIGGGLSALTFVYSYLGLFRPEAGGRRIHVAQMVLSIPAPLVVIVLALLVYHLRGLPM